MTGSKAIRTFSGGFANDLISFILSELTPCTAPYAAIKAGSALPKSLSTAIYRSDI